MPIGEEASMHSEGALTWYIPDAYLPAGGSGPLVGHEAICVLNTSDQRAHIEVDFYFEDREPHPGVAFSVGPQRTLHVRTDRPQMLGASPSRARCHTRCG